jgi:peptidyl-prolyl cis-trans isomerase C
MIRIPYLLAAAAASLCIGHSTAMAEGSPDDVLVENSMAKLTRGDYEADLLRVPPDLRPAFASDPKRLTLLLNSMLIAKTLAAEARAAGVDREPEVARMLALETDRALAQVQIRRIEEAAGAEFDAKTETMLVKAREDYAVQKDRYRGSEEVQASHILFSTETSSPEAALARANETRAKLLAGADFATLAKEISDDPSAKTNLGELGWFGSGKMDPAFTKAAFEVKNVGDISEPVQSRFGYHLIRLEGRRPARQLSFDEVKEKIMADLRKRYIDDRRDTKIASIKTDPKMKVDQKAVDGLVYHTPREIRGSPQQPK